MAAEFRNFAVPLECLLEADLKMHHMITASSINVTVWDILDLILIFYGFMKFGTRRDKLITTFNCTNKTVNICCFKAFPPACLYFSAHIVHMLPFIIS